MPQDPKKRALVERVLDDPTLFPPEFKAYIPRALHDNLNLEISKQQITGISGEPWRNLGDTGQPALTSPWRSYQGGGTAFGKVRFFKDYLGFVHIDGLAETTGTPSGAVIFTLPISYRPSQQVMVIARGSPAGTEAAVRLDLYTNGDIAVVTPAAASFTSGSWISLANIHFRAL
jgi:hypothetical protein